MAIIANEPLSCNYCQRLTEPRDTHIFETCEHIFHSACIDQERPICPICNPMCLICRELTTEDSRIQLACNHIFHTDCIQELKRNNYLSSLTNTSCPICRATIPLEIEDLIRALVIYKVHIADPVLGEEFTRPVDNLIILSAERLLNVIADTFQREENALFLSDFIHVTYKELLQLRFPDLENMPLLINRLNEAMQIFKGNPPMAIDERPAPPFISNTVMVAMVLLLSFLYALLPSRV